MIISNEQVRLSLQSLRHTKSDSDMMDPGNCLICEVSPELLKRISENLAELPETRRERVERARDDLASGTLTADQVADKMIGRIISDALR